MPIITREDGVQFVIRAYREYIPPSDHTQIIDKVRHIAAEQGEFVRLFGHPKQGYEAVFSNQAGYLLGESIKNYFPRMRNLLFVEATHREDQFLFIAIHQGQVFIDNLLSLAALQQELLGLSALNTRFQIMLSGRLPQDVSDFKKGFFPEALIDTLEYIKEPLLPILPSSKHTKLVPLSIALKSKRLNRHSLLGRVSIAGLMVLVILSLCIGFYCRQIDNSHSSLTAYTLALSRANASQLLAELSIITQHAYLAPAWEVTEILQKPPEYYIKMVSEHGRLAPLKTWSKQQGYQLAITNEGATLSTQTQVSASRTVTAIAPLDDCALALMDNIKGLFYNAEISISDVIQHHESREASIHIQVQDVSPQQLLLLSKRLGTMPVVIKQTDLQITTVPLLNLTLELSIWGS